MRGENLKVLGGYARTRYERKKSASRQPAGKAGRRDIFATLSISLFRIPFGEHSPARWVSPRHLVPHWVLFVQEQLRGPGPWSGLYIMEDSHRDSNPCPRLISKSFPGWRATTP